MMPARYWKRNRVFAQELIILLSNLTLHIKKKILQKIEIYFARSWGDFYRSGKIYIYLLKYFFFNMKSKI